MESEEGVVFRIGGDEFAGILCGEDVAGRCEMALSRFKLAMDGHNAVKNQALRISIASGYAVYDKNQEDERLMDVYQQADVCMYENKKQIKSEQIKPSDFYAGRQ